MEARVVGGSVSIFAVILMNAASMLFRFDDKFEKACTHWKSNAHH